eukprot:Blabericola_migrator_1__2176@NODE_15_length_23605_cov_67_423868_g12_i0_p10_GENE_NODE_15_length_23605_cov_67_423868_g12_i0NODE_15_length_23605_cov_67_423868_g12_i0_p10_ORF_typecomplete_len191_score18_90_NODE_15_length_23605_cov_67_423868_g12_i079858557
MRFFPLLVAAAQSSWWDITNNNQLYTDPVLPSLPVRQAPTQAVQCAGIWKLHSATTSAGNYLVSQELGNMMGMQLVINTSERTNGVYTDALLTMTLGGSISAPVRMPNTCVGEIELLSTPTVRNAFGWTSLDPADAASFGLQHAGEFMRHLYAMHLIQPYKGAPSATLTVRAIWRTPMGPVDVAMHFTPA